MKNELCVPLTAVQIDGTSPAPGDEVDVAVKGTVHRVEGDRVYVVPATANGEPVEPAAAEEPEGDEGDLPMNEDGLRARAAREDETY
jgi:hypothetical protein